ncbi:MAG: FAD-binding oxidoreductase, partial [Spiribacter salinus]
MSDFPANADVVIVGLGGIVGASTVHHLIERGWTRIVGIDKSAIPTDIGSTSHASDFCYATSHDPMTCYTTMYSINFFAARDRYDRVGGLEVARVGDDERMEELKRKVTSGRAFGTRAHMIDAAEAKRRFPLLEEDVIQGALWDPDAGLVKPRSQVFSGELVDEAVATGHLSAWPNTACTGLIIEDGRIRGVETPRGRIEADYVVVCAGLWGRLIANMA